MLIKWEHSKSLPYWLLTDDNYYTRFLPLGTKLEASSSSNMNGIYHFVLAAEPVNACVKCLRISCEFVILHQLYTIPAVVSNMTTDVPSAGPRHHPVVFTDIHCQKCQDSDYTNMTWTQKVGGSIPSVATIRSA